MSTLRNQLDQLKAGHDAARYPGDLASDIFSQGASPLRLTPSASKPVTANRWFWALGSSSAIAASLIVGFLLTARPGSSNNPAANPGYTTGLPAAPGVTARTVDTNRNLSNTPEFIDPLLEGAPNRSTSPIPYSIDLAGSNTNLQRTRP